MVAAVVLWFRHLFLNRRIACCCPWEGGHVQGGRLAIIAFFIYCTLRCLYNAVIRRLSIHSAAASTCTMSASYAILFYPTFAVPPSNLLLGPIPFPKGGVCKSARKALGSGGGRLPVCRREPRSAATKLGPGPRVVECGDLNPPLSVSDSKQIMAVGGFEGSISRS